MPDTTFHARWLLGPGLALGTLAAASASAQDCFDEEEVADEDIRNIASVLTTVGGRVVHDTGVLN